MKHHTIQVAAALALLASSAVHAQQAVQWKVADGGNGHWYQTVRLTTFCAFDSAARIARSVGGHLATINTEAELNLIGSFDSPQGGAWTGGVVQNSGCYLGSGCNIPCVGGEPTWESGEPWYAPLGNYVNCWGGGRYGLAAANGGFRWQPVWVDQYGNPIDSLIVEWDADCNADGVVDYGQCHDGTLPDYNGNNIPDCCEQGVACFVGSYPVQWRVEDGGNGHWYELAVNTPRNWIDARSCAMSIGGHLATFHSQDEWHFIESKFDGVQGYWIGLFQDPPTGLPPDQGWRWVTDEPLTFNPWCPGEPNDWVGYQQWVVQAFSTCWDDTTESGIQAPVVEWSADCNNDAIVDYGQILQGQFADANTDGIPDTCQCGTIPSLPTCCPGDLDYDAAVGGADIGLLLSNWGPCGSACLYDLNNDDKVNGGDLGLLLAGWGPCPN